MYIVWLVNVQMWPNYNKTEKFWTIFLWNENLTLKNVSVLKIQAGTSCQKEIEKIAIKISSHDNTLESSDFLKFCPLIKIGKAFTCRLFFQEMWDLALGHSTANKDYRSEQFVKVTITNKIKISGLSNVQNVCKY